MTSLLSELRKSKGAMRDKIIKDLESGGKTNQEDTRFWKLSRDKTGNGSAVIRILPPVNGDELPWVKNYSYGFKSEVTGRWYINDSPTSIGMPDPVAELNSAAYMSKDEGRIEEAKKRKRRAQFISNILVIKDPANPENDGKVFLWKFGKKIMDMIQSKATPEFEDEESVYVWDIDEGCNMKLRIKTVSNYPNYDNSEWAAPSPLASSDDEMQKILDKTHRLSEFSDPGYFKSYDDLAKELERVMNGTKTTAESEARKSIAEEESKFDLDAEVRKKATTSVRKVEKKPVVTDDEDDLESFKALLNDI